MKAIHEIVLTGGPCGGKTTALSKIQSWLMDRGFRVFIAPETATIVIGGGIRDIGLIAGKNPKKYRDIQKEMLRMQLSNRTHFWNLAKLFNEPIVILYDRGPMDGAAYMERNYFEAMIEEEHYTLSELRDSFDGVIHLVTAANGAREFYTTANNEARRETPEEAILLDEKTKEAWVGHPHLKIIDNPINGGGFDLKLRRATSAIARIIGIPVPIEIERKFLVKSVPESFLSNLPNLHTAKIEQIYIEGTDETRIRKRIASDGSAIYSHTIKSPGDTIGIRYERENKISPTQFADLQKSQKQGTITIFKKRHCFVWNSQYFELDIFKSHDGLILLEVELTEENDSVDLPPSFEIEKEVTGDSAYSNAVLAQIK